MKIEEIKEDFELASSCKDIKRTIFYLVENPKIKNDLLKLIKDEDFREFCKDNSTREFLDDYSNMRIDEIENEMFDLGIESSYSHH